MKPSSKLILRKPAINRSWMSYNNNKSLSMMKQNRNRRKKMLVAPKEKLTNSKLVLLSLFCQTPR